MIRILRTVLVFPSVSMSKIALLLGVILGATFFEGFGVAMLYPVMDFIEKGKDFDALRTSSRMWYYIASGFEAFSIPKSLFSLAGIVFLLLMFRQAFNYTRSIYSNYIIESILADIRSKGFEWFVNADMSFYDNHASGEMINALTTDGTRAGGSIFNLFNLLASVMIFVFYILFLLKLSLGMTLFAICIMAVIGVILRSKISRSAVIGSEISRLNESISKAIIERLSGVRLMKLSGRIEDEVARVGGESERIRVNSFHLAKIRAKLELVVDPMVVFAGLTMLCVSTEVFHMTLSKSGMFIFVLLRMMPYTKEIFNSRQALASLSGSLFRVEELFRQARGAAQIVGGTQEKVKLVQAIRFENVSFAYNESAGDVLKDISVSIPAGKMTAVVGKSGVGKSTLVDLIPRLRVPRCGAIFFDDVPVEQYNLKCLRRSIAMVSQEGFLFDDSIENNIRYCKPNAERSDVIAAARDAFADDFVKALPDGYQTIVGERGVKLSGGQKQRISLARALLQGAPIVILDEPTSSLDSESEIAIQQAIARIRAKRSLTLIIIAHRLSTIHDADQIIVIEEGRVKERGRHSELMNEEEWYSRMVRIQSRM